LFNKVLLFHVKEVDAFSPPLEPSWAVTPVAVLPSEYFRLE